MRSSGTSGRDRRHRRRRHRPPRGSLTQDPAGASTGTFLYPTAMASNVSAMAKRLHRRSHRGPLNLRGLQGLRVRQASGPPRLRVRRRRRGPPGPRGPQGAPDPPGPAGPTGESRRSSPGALVLLTGDRPPTQRAALSLPTDTERSHAPQPGQGEAMSSPPFSWRPPQARKARPRVKGRQGPMLADLSTGPGAERRAPCLRDSRARPRCAPERVVLEEPLASGGRPSPGATPGRCAPRRGSQVAEALTAPGRDVRIAGSASLLHTPAATRWASPPRKGPQPPRRPSSGRS